MTHRIRPQLLLSLLLCSLVTTICAAQSIATTDPWTGGSASGATGMQPMSPPPPDTGHSAGDDKLLQFKSETTLIQVPVVVTDRSGGHIHGLTKADFTILENGKMQKIATLEEIVPASATSTTPIAGNPGGVFSNMTPDESKPRSLTVLLLDEVNTAFLDQSYGRKQLVKYLANHLDSSQPTGLMVLTSKGVSVLSPLDSDPATLITALKKASGKVSEMETYDNDAKAVAAGQAQFSGLGGIHPGDSPENRIRAFMLAENATTGTNIQARAVETTLRGLLSIALSLSGIPGRKSLVWVTGSFPFDLDNFGAMPADVNMRALYERTLNALNDAQVSMYPVDARGLLSDPTFAGDNMGSMLGAGTSDALRQSTITSLKNIAAMTGGVAYYNSNDLAGAFGRAAQDSSSYYSLTYYMDRHNTKPGWRKLQVEVPRKDTEVRARAGYLVTDLAVNPERTHKADVEFALISPFESTGIPITSQWQGLLADGTKRKVGFVLHVPATNVVDEADKNRIDVEFVAQATSNGVPAGTVSQTIKGMIVPDTLAKLKADGVIYNNVLSLAPGDYQIRFIVRDNLNGKIGSVFVPLTVN
jgi:VWFA-related protein